MKFLKSAAVLLLVMALLCSLAACGGETARSNRTRNDNRADGGSHHGGDH